MVIDHLLTCEEGIWNGLVRFEQKLAFSFQWPYVFNLASSILIPFSLVGQFHMIKISWAPVELAKSLPQPSNFSPAANHILQTIHTFFSETMFWLLFVTCLVNTSSPRHPCPFNWAVSQTAIHPYILYTSPQLTGCRTRRYEKLWPFFCGAIKWGCLGPWLWIINSSPQ